MYQLQKVYFRTLVVAIAGLIGALSPGCAHMPVSELPEWSLADTQQSIPTGPPPDYRIQLADVLGITFANNPEFSQDVTVRPDGKISLPYLDEIRVLNRTPADIDNELTARYSAILRQPEITIILRTFAAQRVFVGGEVNQPGLIPLTGHTSALQAIFSAGGFLNTAKIQQVVLIRKGPDNQPIGRSLNLTQVLETGNLQQDVRLMPSDILFVPKAPIARLNLFVEQYVRGLLPISTGLGFSVP